MSRKMKDSGVDWIGKIPQKWKLVRVKHLFSLGRGRVIAKTELDENGLYPVYSSQTKNQGILGYINTYDFDKRQLTWTTDGANAGTVFLRDGKYNCTNVCGTLLPKLDNFSLRYMKYALEYIAIFHKRADTNGYKIMNNEMAEIKTIYPPQKDQKMIADFLDIKTSEIDTILEKTRQSIEELKAYKQSLITETVTKGLNPDVPMKDSGIDWVGSMPTTWERVALKRLTVVTNGREIKTEVSNNKDSIPVYGTGKKPFKYTDVPLLDGEYIIFGRKGTIGEPYRLNDRFWIVDTAYAAKNTQYSNLNYLYYLLTIFPWELFKTQTAIPSVVASEVIQTRVPYPDVEIQNEIVEFLDNRTRQIDNVINKKHQMIKELESYKQSLIYEYVTGKKEVE